MIVIDCALNKDFIVELLNNYEGEVTYKHIETKGIKMTFECSKDNEQSAVLAKSIIKKTEIGSVLYFSSKHVNG